MMLDRLAQWSRRTNFPTSARAGLEWGAEYWDSDPTHYEGWSELRDLYKSLGRKRTKRDLAFDLSGHLLDEVLAAAGGVEHAIIQLRAAVADLRRWADENSAQRPIGLAHPAATEALYGFGDVITWARAVEERLDRRPRGKLRRQGLVPALKPVRLSKRVEALLKQLRSGPVGECRQLANFTLHAALVRGPYSGARVTADGALTLPIPDSQVQPVDHWYLLTWNDGRDGIAFAEEVWKSIQEFIDKLLTAFGKAVSAKAQARSRAAR
jgi:hypothetical protein